MFKFETCIFIFDTHGMHQQVDSNRETKTTYTAYLGRGEYVERSNDHFVNSILGIAYLILDCIKKSLLNRGHLGKIYVSHPITEVCIVLTNNNITHDEMIESNSKSRLYSNNLVSATRNYSTFELLCHLEQYK